MKRDNPDLLRRSLDAVLAEFTADKDRAAYHEAFDNFVWHLSVARSGELDSVYDYLIDGDRFWEWPTSILAIFGRVYAVSLGQSDPEKTAEVVERLLFPYTDQAEWRDLVGALELENIRMK